MFWLIALWVVPVAAFWWARRRVPQRLWRITGVAFGSIVSPAATGLYALYFIGPVAALLGLVGLPLALIHGGPGYDLAIHLGLIQPRTIVEGTQHIYVELLNGVVWSCMYGMVGWVVDWWRARSVRRSVPVGGA